MTPNTDLVRAAVEELDRAGWIKSSYHHLSTTSDDDLANVAAIISRYITESDLYRAGV